MNPQDIAARIAEQVAALQGIVDQLYRLGASQGEVQDFERVVGALQGIIGTLAGPPPVAPEEDDRQRKSLDGGKTWIPMTDAEIEATEKWAREVWPGYDDPNAHLPTRAELRRMGADAEWPEEK